MTEVVFNRHERLEQLWATVDVDLEGERPAEAPRLDGHLASSFISSFGLLGRLASARRVLDAARTKGVANTIVHNAFLKVCGRWSSSAPVVAGGANVDDGQRAHAIDEARSVIELMEESSVPLSSLPLPSAGMLRAPVDAYTLSLAARILPLPEATGLYHRAGHVADTVAYNALIDAAGRHGEASLALSLLERMEQGTGPAPDEVSYNATLAALARRPTTRPTTRPTELGSARGEADAAASIGPCPPTRDVVFRSDGFARSDRRGDGPSGAYGRTRLRRG